MEHKENFDNDVLVEHNFYQGLNSITVRHNDVYNCIDIIATRDALADGEEVTMCVSLTRDQWDYLIDELQEFVECDDTNGLAIVRYDCSGRSNNQLIITDDSFIAFNKDNDEVISVSTYEVVNALLVPVAQII